MAFMAEVESELYKVGVPVKTRHNEVAPSQYEIAPVFENANVATDHQMMTMETMRRMAPKYGLACLLHEKPFAGVNGSGKHLNWSMSDDEGTQPARPGREHAREHPVPGVLHRRAARGQQVAGAAAGEHRERRQRPPARRERSAAGHPVGLPRRHAHRHLRADRKGRREVDQERRQARHRRAWCCRSCRATRATATAPVPFAFTGNKFEFRAVSSNQSIAYPNIALNVAVTESLDYMATELEKATKGGKTDRTGRQPNCCRR